MAMVEGCGEDGVAGFLNFLLIFSFSFFCIFMVIFILLLIIELSFFKITSLLK